MFGIVPKNPVRALRLRGSPGDLRDQAMKRRVLANLLALSCAALSGSASPPPVQDALAGVPEAARRIARPALDWLCAAQNGDGSWGDNPGFPGEVGNTCIATLALMSTGSTGTRGRYYREIRRGLDWLASRIPYFGSNDGGRDQGTLLQRKLGENIDLYLATLLYSQVLGNAIDTHDDERIQDQLQQAVDRISSLQKANGEWETSYEPILTTISAWLALRQAHDAGIAVHGASADKVVRYLKQDVYDAGQGAFRDQKWGRQMRFVTQAGGLRVLYGMGEGHSPEGIKATEVLVKMSFDQDVGGREGGEEFLGALFAVQALGIEGGPVASNYFDAMTQALGACQNKDGSWLGHHCITGRVFCTATSILTLLSPARMLPMVER